MLNIQWASYTDPWLIQDMGVNHCRRDIIMPQQFLYRPDIIVRLQQVCGKRMTKRVDIDRFSDANHLHLNSL